MEFSAYGVYQDLMKNMINHDIPDHMIKFFYTSLTREEVSVYYVNEFKAANEYMQTLTSGIVATTIHLLGKTHAVCLVKHKDDHYFFDSNGYITNPYYTYDDELLNTDKLMDVLYLEFNIDYNYSIRLGIQYYCRDTTNLFIWNGGYCMFYIYCFIQWLTCHWREDRNMIMYIVSKIHIDYSRHTGIFPSNLIMPYYSLGVVHHVFKA